MRRHFATLLSLALLAPAALAAQSGSAVITGTVRDSAGNAIPQAEVSLIGKDHKVVTGQDGGYRLANVRPGRYWLGVRRLGYEPVAYSLTIGSGERKHDVEMEPLAQRLSEVQVKERSGFTSSPFSEFEMRRWTSWGWFLTRDDLERQRPARLGYAVAPFMPWLTPAAFDHAPIEGRSFASSSGVALGRRACAPAVSLNGSPAIMGWAVNDFPVEEVEAVEVYRNRDSRIPMEFFMMPGARACGLVIVWTRV